MMCPKCGREIPDGTVCPCNYEVQMLSSNPAVNAIKSSGSSSLVLAALILATAGRLVSLLTSIILIFSGNAYSNITVEGPVNPQVIESAANAGKVMSTVLIIIGFTPVVLMTIGMWMHYATCRNRFSGNISTGGLTLCRIAVIIDIVYAGLIALLVLLYAVMMFAFSGTFSNMFSYMMESGEYGYDYGAFNGFTADMMGGLMIVLGFVMVIVLAVIILMICYYSSVVKLIGRIKASAFSGLPDARISRFLTGMMYFLGVLSCLMGLLMLFGAPVAGLCSIGSAVSVILLAVALGRLRQQMTVLLYPPVQPVYAPQPAAPAPMETPAPVETPVPVETPNPVEVPTAEEVPIPEEKTEE